KFDNRGRLLIGTDSGIYRGIGFSFDYDFTSGGTGILAPSAAAFNPVGMFFTSINGNLQISDTSSVAIDPVSIGRFYAATYATGVMALDGNGRWVSHDETNPFSV